MFRFGQNEECFNSILSVCLEFNVFLGHFDYSPLLIVGGAANRVGVIFRIVYFHHLSVYIFIIGQHYVY